MEEKLYQELISLAKLIEKNYSDKESFQKVIEHYWGAPKMVGQTPKWICRFHDDHHPSFVINPNNSCGCWSCNTYFFSVIKFIMASQNMKFKQATLDAARILNVVPEHELSKFYNKSNKSFSPIQNEQPIITIDSLFSDNKKQQKTYPYPNVESLNNVYSIFMMGNTLINKPLLKDNHLKELLEHRELTMEEINKIGFFSFPDKEIIYPLIEKLKEKGLNESILQYVPGFYYSKEEKKWEIKELPDKVDGYCIPIRNLNGKIIAIQIRTDMKNKKYIWFSSSFAKHFYNEPYNDVCGNSPGSPISVVYPKELKNSYIFITEGFYKANAIAKKYNCIALSVQGVYNTSNIKQIVNQIIKYYHTNTIFIAFDADMAEKVQVLRAALRVGLMVSNANLGQYKDAWDTICSQNKNKKIYIKDYVNEAKIIYEIFKKIPIRIYYCIWNSKTAKGIDDAIQNEKIIKKIILADFWKYSFNILANVDIYEKSKNKTIDQENMYDIFKKYLINKII